ncbi:MAG: M23 family metallopeptidase [Bacteroidales bacterium]|jgi:hypothetical protein|nr:M23 family metallopeptidase [Bacteroidales bacterium]
MAFIRLVLINLFLAFPLTGIQTDEKFFIPPVNIPLLLSANFGELRPDHFHSGIDIKTQGVTGKDVIAAADGYVYRIGVSPSGFGKALYMRHPNGYSTVYGHLDRFNDEIEQYVKSRQYSQKSFTVSLFPQKDEFSYKQGDLIAYSGNSGSSGGPHVHYEIRKADSEEPVNPLLFSFGVKDDIRPVLEKLFIYPLSSSTSINGKNAIKQLDLVAGGRGNYSISAGNSIVISGKAGFGIKSYDLLNNSHNKCAVYSIELVIDSTTVYKYTMDGFSFDESKYVNSHMDYATYIRSRIQVQKAYILPNDRLRTYTATGRGVFNFSDGRTHKVDFHVADVHGNRSTLSFNVRSEPGGAVTAAADDTPGITVMPYSRQNTFAAKNVKVTIPANALYDTLRFQYRRIAGDGEMLSDIHQIATKYDPLHRAYTLSIKPDVIIPGKESKMLILKIDDNRKSPLNSTWENGYLTARPATFGSFAAGIDTIPPSISPVGFASENNLTGKRELRIRIKDDLSGIKSYEPEIDGAWALFEYDQKNDLIIYRFDADRITKGIRHNFSLKVSDRQNNTSVYKATFVW